jgi:hypothetical protein
MTPELARIIAAMVDAKLGSIDSLSPTRGRIGRRPTGRTRHETGPGSGHRSRIRR